MSGKERNRMDFKSKGLDAMSYNSPTPTGPYYLHTNPSLFQILFFFFNK